MLTMVYTILKYLMRLTLSTYFKTIKVTGKENIPHSGPIIFVSNHPSTLMDPVVIGALIKPQVYFLAAAEFMGKGMVTKIMGSLFNMIPVYRPDTLPNKASKNSDVFKKCYSHLANDGAILIFPEGSSVTEKRLRTLKTGTARIVLGAEKSNDIQVQIVPIGLNYTDPHSFQSDVFVSIGKPILSTIAELNGVTDEIEKVKTLTNVISEHLKDNLIHIEDTRLELLFEKIATISKHELQNVDGKKPSLEDRYDLSMDIQKGLEFYAKKHPEILEILNNKLDNYIKRSSFYGITDASVAKGSSRVGWFDYVKIILGIPVFVFGYITNSLPYFFAIWAVRKMKVDHSFQGSIGLSFGLITYLIWYMGWGVFLSKITGIWWAGFGLFLIVYFTGRFTLSYLRLITNIRQQGNLKRLLKKNRNLLESLQDERSQIMDDIVMYSEISKERG